jgi:hypothetical protein
VKPGRETAGPHVQRTDGRIFGILRFRVTRCLAALASSILWVVADGQAATDVLVNNYDNFRTGANLSESILNVSNVKPETFGRLFSYSVDGAVLSQPLVVSGINSFPMEARRQPSASTALR